MTLQNIFDVSKNVIDETRMSITMFTLHSAILLRTLGNVITQFSFRVCDISFGEEM